MNVVVKLDVNNKTKKGCPVVVYFRAPGIRKQIAIGKFLNNNLYYFKKNEWDFKNNIPIPSATNYDVVYPKIINFKKAFENLMLKNETDVNSYLRVLNENDADLQIKLLEKQLANLKKEQSVGLFSFFDTIIQEKKNKGESIRIYKQTKTQLELCFVKEQSLNAINYEWLQKFILFKKQTGTGEAGINTYLRTLRALYKEAQRRESLNVKKGNPFTGLIKTVNATVEVDFKPKYFEKIKNYIPKKDTNNTAAKNMKRAVDLWIFQYVIGGHDFIDIALLKWSQIKNNRIKFKRYKNRSKPNGGVLINNKLLPVAAEIIKKYSTKNNKRVFGFIPDPENDAVKYANYRSNFNRTLRIISEDLELPSVLKSKSTRYVFRSFAGELLISDLVIMQLQGHKPKGVSFGYQKSLPNAVIDKFLKKIIKKSKLN